MVDQVFESVAALRCRGQSEPVARRYPVENAEECTGGDVVTFVDDDESVAGGDVLDVFATGKCRQQCDVEDAGDLRPSTADLAALEPQVLLDPVAPLVGEGFAVNQDQRAGRTRSDCGTGDHSLAGARGSDEDTRVLCKDLL